MYREWVAICLESLAKVCREYKVDLLTVEFRNDSLVYEVNDKNLMKICGVIFVFDSYKGERVLQDDEFESEIRKTFAPYSQSYN
jgi:hypothetical protein